MNNPPKSLEVSFFLRNFTLTGLTFKMPNLQLECLVRIVTIGFHCAANGDSGVSPTFCIGRTQNLPPEKIYALLICCRRDANSVLSTVLLQIFK